LYFDHSFLYLILYTKAAIILYVVFIKKDDKLLTYFTENLSNNHKYDKIFIIILNIQMI